MTTNTDETEAPPLPDAVAASPDVYADRTVDEIKTVVRDARTQDRLTVDNLVDVYAHERAHKDRITLARWLADRIREAGGTLPDDGPGEHEQADADADADADSDGDDDAGADADANAGAGGGGDADADTPAYDPDATTVVTVEAPGTGYYGGIWFDSAGAKNVEWTGRVESAVRDGPLRLRTARDETAIPPELRPDHFDTRGRSGGEYSDSREV